MYNVSRYDGLSLSDSSDHCERKADYLSIHTATPIMLIVGISGPLPLLPRRLRKLFHSQEQRKKRHKRSQLRWLPPPRTKRSCSLALFAIIN